jgi:hypothetical protein
VKLTTEQHAVLSAMVEGEPHTLWPMMRRCLLRLGLIEPAGPPPPPSEVRHRQKPVRPYAVTEAGKIAVKAFAGMTKPHHERYPKILFGKAAGQ